MDLRRTPKLLSTSPRHLALRHGRRRLRQLDASIQDVPPSIEKGQEQLYSFYVPGLSAGEHIIEIQQDIEANGQKKPVKNDHNFNVIAPRFSLPEGAIYSFYPPQGHSDRSEVVPNVLFTDPTLPWERVASWESERHKPEDYERNRVPWLAVLLFTEDELRLNETDLSAVLDKTTAKGSKQTSTLSVSVLAKEAATANLLQKTRTAIPFDVGIDEDNAKTDVIFLRSQLFNALFTRYDSDGNPVTGQEKCHVYHHRFLAHLRHINLDNTPAAATTDEDDHAYSVVVCHRTGPLDITKPTTVIAHLVNIEAVEAMTFPVQDNFVAMSSLHSWEYTCLPPNSLNIKDAFAYLGDHLSVLKPTLDKEEIKALRAQGPVGDRLAERLDDGYSMLRYRVQTGEVTAAFSRSPFTTTTVDFPKETHPWPASSTTGTKLQILDPQLNIMDITYSAAWNLGKTLGLANQDFAAALSRVRKQIYDIGMNAARGRIMKERAASLGMPAYYKTAEEVISTIAATISKVGALPEQNLLQQRADGMARRWFRPAHPDLDLSYKGPFIRAISDDEFQKAAKKIASSAGDENQPYNEYNTPYSTDWALVLNWVLDRYYLVDVPAHYLITDPSHVPLESLRFFNVDHNWVSAMIDGGLSLANHLDQTDDRVRDAIKYAINWYLTTKIPKLNYEPPIPLYGFYVHSELVTKFPDLIVDLDPPPSKAYAPVSLRHQLVDQGTMLCLMREPPVESEFKSLFLREPPHQQYFSAAAEITKDKIDMFYRRAYTVSPMPDKDHHRDPIKYQYQRNSPAKGRAIYIWGSADDIRCLNVETLATDYVNQLKTTFKNEGHDNWYTDGTPNAALIGIQLNEPQWQLDIAIPTKETFPGLFAAAANKEVRTLRLPPREAVLSLAHPSMPEFSIQCSPHPYFGNRKRHSPVKLRYAPPHFHFPRTDPIPHPALDRPISVAVGPKFDYKVYPVGKPDQPIPMLAGRQDLVFSIVFTGTAAQFNIEYLTVYVPLDAPDTMIKPYTGAGPTMLSNLRFNVIAQFGTKETKNFLILTLKPRSTLGYVPLKKVHEMSFLLSGVIIQPYPAATTRYLDVVEKYQMEDGWTRQLVAHLEPVPKE